MQNNHMAVTVRTFSKQNAVGTYIYLPIYRYNNLIDVKVLSYCVYILINNVAVFCILPK